MGAIPKELKQRILLWLDREGPFWDDERLHDEGEYFECQNHLVTDTGLAEAACSVLSGSLSTAVISFSPSDFEADPLLVSWRGSAQIDEDVHVRNAWANNQFDSLISDLEQAPHSWDELFDWVERACPNLLLSPNIKDKLGIQFIPNVANRSQILLSRLNDIVAALKQGDAEKFSSLRKDWMEGENARFTPSSESELNDFSNRLTFRHPVTGNSIVCSWHGKIKTPQYRIHFQWPMPIEDEKLFVAYLGEKLTKR